MTEPDARAPDDGRLERPTDAERRARRVEREAVDRACTQLAASGELTEERRRAVATLAARLRRRLVDDTITAARGQACREDGERVDPAEVAALLSE